MSTNKLESAWVNERPKMANAGSTNISLLENMRGFNHTGVKSFLPKNKDSRGHVFFTRPQLNLSLSNIQSNRKFIGLLNTDELSMAKYVRMMLDPRLVAGYKIDKTAKPDIGMKETAVYFNNQQAFIPLLTNNLLTLSGWPDILVPSHVRAKELFGAEPAVVDGTTDIRGQISLNASFRTSTGNPITNMMAYWSAYMAAIFAGTLSPYPDFIIENELDYNTRIFRIITASAGKFVTNIAATGPGFVEAVGIGRLFDYTSEEQYSDTADSVSFSFKMHGVEYNDPILVAEFNKIGAIFKPEMLRPHLSAALVKIPHSVKHLFNYEGYPHISYMTGELEVYIETEIVEALLSSRTADSIRSDVRQEIIKGNTAASINNKGKAEETREENAVGRNGTLKQRQG